MHAKSQLTNTFSENLSKLIVEADSNEKALKLSDHIVEIILTMRKSQSNFQTAISMLHDID